MTGSATKDIDVKVVMNDQGRVQLATAAMRIVDAVRRAAT